MDCAPRRCESLWRRAGRHRKKWDKYRVIELMEFNFEWIPALIPWIFSRRLWIAPFYSFFLSISFHLISLTVRNGLKWIIINFHFFPPTHTLFFHGAERAASTLTASHRYDEESREKFSISNFAKSFSLLHGKSQGVSWIVMRMAEAIASHWNSKGRLDSTATHSFSLTARSDCGFSLRCAQQPTIREQFSPYKKKVRCWSRHGAGERNEKFSHISPTTSRNSYSSWNTFFSSFSLTRHHWAMAFWALFFGSECHKIRWPKYSK